MSLSELTVKPYNNQAEKLSAEYNSLATEEVHPGLRRILTAPRLAVLDLGAGAGRDAAWIASLGHEVTAIEPATDLRRLGAAAHKTAPIAWFDDLLPRLGRTINAGHTFDFVLLSAVWMHVPPEHREEAFRSLLKVTRPNGRILITLRHGPSPKNRPMYPVSVEELQALSTAYMAQAEEITTGEKTDKLGRAEVSWQTVLISVPEGYQRGLEIVRNEVFFARRSSSYKLGMVRAVLDTAQRSPQLLESIDDYTSRLPMREVTIAWAESYLSLMKMGIVPRSQSLRASLSILANVENIARRLEEDAPFEIIRALRDCREIIRKHPAAHMFEDRLKGKPLFCVESAGDYSSGSELDQLFGHLKFSRRLAETLHLHGPLISGGLLVEWSKFISQTPHMI